MNNLKNTESHQKEDASQTQRPTVSSDWLTPEEIADLERDSKETMEYLRNSDYHKKAVEEYRKLREK